MRDLMLLGTAKQLQNYRGGGRGLAHGPSQTPPPASAYAAPCEVGRRPIRQRGNLAPS